MKRNLIENEEGLIGIILLIVLLFAFLMVLTFIQAIGLFTFAGIMLIFFAIIVFVKVKFVKITWWNPAIWLMFIGVIIMIIGYGFGMETVYFDF